MINSYVNILKEGKLMILDSEEQRNVLLGLINTSTFSGQAIDQVFMLKQAVVSATLHTQPHVPPPPGKVCDPPHLSVKEE
jgi:hypothetical protein